MKVLQINCVYQSGSTGKLTHEIHQGLLRRGVESVVVYGRGKRIREEGVYKVCTEGYAKANNLLSRLRGTMYGGCFLSTRRLIKILEREKPDVVHLQCVNGYFVNIYRLVQWLKERRVKTVLTLHAEFPYTANCGYALDCEKWRSGCGNCPRLRQETKSLFFDGTARSFRQMERVFRGFEKDLAVVSVSPWIQRRAEVSPILGGMKHALVLNGVDTNLFTYRPAPGIHNEKILLHTTAKFCDEPGHLKGGGYVLELAKRMTDAPIKFLVAGKHRISGEVPPNVILLGNMEDQERLAEYYAMADLTLLTSRQESFSMPCAESLCCGTPVVGFRAGGPETIAIPRYAEFVEPGDLDGLEEAVRRWLDVRVDKKAVCGEAKKRYSGEKMVEEYLEIYRSMVHGNSG